MLPAGFGIMEKIYKRSIDRQMVGYGIGRNGRSDMPQGEGD